MAWWEWPVRIGGYAAAPWTGGMSIPGAEGAIAAFGGKDDKKKDPTKDSPFGAAAPFAAQLERSAGANQATANQFQDQSASALGPALEYLTKLAGGDPAALMDATRQERGRVIDQYDTARRAISNFGPRGGGTTSALAESRFTQAESLADITSSARKDAVAQLSELGPQLGALGLTAQQLASMDLNSLISTLLTREGFDVQKRGQNMEMWGGIGEALGTLAGIWATRGKK